MRRSPERGLIALLVRNFRASLAKGAISLMAVLCPELALAQDDEGQAGAISLSVSYTAEVNQVASGGAAQTGRYLDNLDIQAEADLEKLIGWQGARVFAYGLYNNGRAFSPDVGDAFVTSNIETGTKALRLYELWLEQDLAGGISLRAGLYDLNSEFDALDSAGLFLNSAHGIGADISQSGVSGPSIFPSTSLAARVAVEFGDDWRARVAVLDGVPGDPDHPARTAIKLGNGDGALVIGEVERGFGGGKLIAGLWHYTSRFEQFDGRQARANRGAYVRGETMLLREADDNEQGLAGFFRLGAANGAINGFDRFASLGLNYRGPLPGRSEDQLGLALATALTSAEYRLASGAGRSETNIELTYRAQLTQWLSIQPDLQYVINPGPFAANDNALVAGLRAEIGFQF